MELKIEQKAKNNAISAYLMVLISGLFLFNKSNKNLNTPFVKNHTKVAFLIHISFLLTYIVFISYDFLKEYVFFGYSINYILASSIFTFLFIVLLYGIYKASQEKIFKIGDLLTLGHTKNIIDVNGDKNINEKDKLTLILCHIPFIGFIVSGRYYTNPTIKNIVTFNLLISFTIIMIYILGYNNLSLFLFLPYIVFSVFSSINIVYFEKIIGINIHFLPTPENKINNLKALFKYIGNYFSKSNFIGIVEIKKSERNKRINQEINNKEKLSKFEDIKLPKILIYIPILNLLTLFFIKTKQKFHIINGLMITLIFIILLILNHYLIINPEIILLLLFPIFFGIGYLNSRLAYKMPFIFDIFELLNNFKKLFIKTNKKINDIKAENHEENIKVGEIKD